MASNSSTATSPTTGVWRSTSAARERCCGSADQATPPTTKPCISTIGSCSGVTSLRLECSPYSRTSPPSTATSTGGAGSIPSTGSSQRRPTSSCPATARSPTSARSPRSATTWRTYASRHANCGSREHRIPRPLPGSPNTLKPPGPPGMDHATSDTRYAPSTTNLTANNDGAASDLTTRWWEFLAFRGVPCDGLGLQVFLETGGAPLTSQTAVLVPTEGQMRSHPAAATVETSQTGAQLRRNPIRPNGIARPHSARQAEQRVVGQRHGVVVVLKGNDHADRSKNLSLRDGHRHA